MFSIIGKIFDWVFGFFGNIFSSFTLRDQNAFLQTKLTETQKELAPSKESATQLETENAQLKARLAQIEQKNEKSFDLNANSLQILRLLAQNDSRFTIQEMEVDLKFPRVEIQYTANQLLKHKYLMSYRPNSIRDAPRYGLTDKGRSFVIEKP